MRSVAGCMLAALMVATGCTGTVTIEDTPETRHAIALEIAQMAKDNGAYQDMLADGAARAQAATADAIAIEIGRNLTEEEITSVNTALQRILADFVSEAEWEEVMVAATEKSFSAGDLAAIRDFYSSPVGQRLLAGEDALALEIEDGIEAILRERLDEFIDRVDAEIQAALAEGVR